MVSWEGLIEDGCSDDVGLLYCTTLSAIRSPKDKRKGREGEQRDHPLYVVTVLVLQHLARDSDLEVVPTYTRKGE